MLEDVDGLHEHFLAFSEVGSAAHRSLLRPGFPDDVRREVLRDDEFGSTTAAVPE